MALSLATARHPSFRVRQRPCSPDASPRFLLPRLVPDVLNLPTLERCGVGLTIRDRVPRELKVRLGLSARRDDSEDNVGDETNALGGFPELRHENRQNLAKASQHLHEVGEGDEPVVARVRLDLVLPLHPVLGGRDGKADAAKGFAAHGALRARFLARAAALVSALGTFALAALVGVPATKLFERLASQPPRTAARKDA